MSIKHRVAPALLLPLVVWSISGPASPGSAAETSASPPSKEEISAKRKEVRERLMLPSLAGIRGMAYGVVGFENSDQLEKELGDKLGKLGIKLSAFGQLKDGTEPIDALVHVHFMKMGKYGFAELTVSQWTALVRSPKTKVRAVTYRNRVFVPASNGEQALAELTDQLVTDFEKANKKQAAAIPAK